MDHYQKYLKYKNKYVSIKQNTQNLIIHISGFPGSGKTTLGEKLEKMLGTKVIVYDTDGFIQHHNKAGKTLLKLEKEEKWTEYSNTWKNIMENKINDFIKQYNNKIIIFVGSLDNFAPPNTIYKIKADYKIMFDVPLHEIMKRYYLRMYYTDQKMSKKEAHHYWINLSRGIYNISSSKEIIKNYNKYIQWHKNNGYEFMSDDEIVSMINKLL